LGEALSVVPLNGLTEAAPCAGQLHCILAVEEASGRTCPNEPNKSQVIMDSLLKVLHDPINRIHQDCTMWLKIFKVYRHIQPYSLSTLHLCQKLSSLARKQSNFMLAFRLNQYLLDHPLNPSDDMDKEILELNIKYEGALLKHAEGNTEEALSDLWSLVRPSILSTISGSSGISTSLSLIVKACLKLSTWIEQKNSTHNLNTFIPKAIKDLLDFDGFQNGAEKPLSGDSVLVSSSNCYALSQEIVGTARKISCELCPSMGKAWLAYASWCFTHANYSMSGTDLNLLNSISPFLQSELSPDRYHLTDNEKSEVEEIIRSICAENSANHIGHDYSATTGCYSFSQENSITSLIEQAVCLIETAAGAPGSEAREGEDPSAVLKSDLTVLCKCDSAKGIVMPLIDRLIEFWWSLRKRRVSLFGHAAHAYFQYLSYSSSELQPSYHRDALKGKTRSYTLRALLYLLHIILNYAVELNGTLERGLSTVPLLPWKVHCNIDVYYNIMTVL
jgi:serine/threonine-protein kinase SMG1